MATISLGGFSAVAAPVGTLGTLSTPFFPGDGNSNTNFIIDVNRFEGIEIGIKAKASFQGDVPFENMAYQAVAGESDPGLATWNVDFSFNFGASTIDDYSVLLLLDFDPAVGSTPASLLVNANPAVAGLSLVQDSQNLGFPFFQALGNPNIQAFDPFAVGEYEIGIQVFNLDDELVAEVSSLVNVSNVPVPAALPLLAFGIGGLVFLGRKRRAKA